VLHTWSRTLEYHPHAHLLVTAGGLVPDGTAWRKPAHARFLVPGYMLSEIFRAKMRDALIRAGVVEPTDGGVWDRPWTVHVQQIGAGDHAVRYLARYVYRVALTNHALDRFADGRVTFRYTQARTGEPRRHTLPVDAFLTRFLQHVLPRSFPKIRAYGLLSPGRRSDLEDARAILRQHAIAAGSPNASPSARTAVGQAVPLPPASPAADTCPVCARGHLVFLHRIPRARASRAPP
jgi:hypothetical protein